MKAKSLVSRYCEARGVQFDHSKLGMIGLQMFQRQRPKFAGDAVFVPALMDEEGLYQVCGSEKDQANGLVACNGDCRKIRHCDKRCQLRRRGITKEQFNRVR